MRQVKRLLMAGGMVALTAALLGAPAAAAGSGKVVFVQGTPGTKVDVCVGSNEVASKLAYGKYATRTLAAGSRTVKFRTAKAGTCTGGVLATWNTTVAAGSLRTVAITKHAPKVVVFPDTVTLGAPIAGLYARAVWRFASDVDGLSLRYAYEDGIVWNPTADAVFAKGQQGVGVAQVDENMLFWGYVQPDMSAVFGPLQVVGEDGWLYEEVVVGTQLSNLRVVRIERLWPFV